MNNPNKMKYADRERYQMDIKWPDPPLNIVLVNPMIPPNTGNIARLCAATGSILHLIKPLGFDLSDKKLRRAGLDYWSSVDINIHENYKKYEIKYKNVNRYFFSTCGALNYDRVKFQDGDHLIFGNEPYGLPDSLLKDNIEKCCNIPIKLNAVRSLNLSNAVSIALYSALRHIHK